MFGVAFNPGNWNSGIVSVGDDLLLLTTLEKGALATGNHYEDRFLSPTRMQWQSQTRTAQGSPSRTGPSGQLPGHAVICLFVGKNYAGTRRPPSSMLVDLVCQLGGREPDHRHLGADWACPRTFQADAWRTEGMIRLTAVPRGAGLPVAAYAPRPGEVRPGAAPRQDPPDRVRPLRGPAAIGAGRGEAGDVRFPRLPAHLREGEGRRMVHSGAAHHSQADASQTRRDQGGAEPYASRAGARTGALAGQVVRGYLAYHAVPTNSRKITSFQYHVAWHWRRALSRRSQKGRVTWARMGRIAARWLPPARISHPWPQYRFLVKHPRWEPSALVAPARICPGGAG